jgi:hypothetical protein
VRYHPIGKLAAQLNRLGLSVVAGNARLHGSPATLQEISALGDQNSAQSASSLEVAGSSWVARLAEMQNLAGLWFSAAARYQDRLSRIAGSSQILNRAKSLMVAAPCR